MASSRNRTGEHHNTTEQRPAKPKPVGEAAAPVHSAGDLATPLEEISGGSFSESAFQRHAALLGDPRMSHPANARQKAAIVQRLQRDYGNQYVQRVVEQVMRSRANGAGGESARESPLVQEAKQENRSGEVYQVGPEITSMIEKEQRQGEPTTAQIRQEKGQTFGGSLADVKAHTGLEVNTLSKEVHTEAFTTGQDILSSESTYAPESDSGRKLVSHELVHVLHHTDPRSEREKRTSLANVNVKHGIQRQGEGPEVPPTAGQQSALLTAALITVENVGDRLRIALGKKPAKPSGSALMSAILSYVAGGTVAGVLAWKLASVVVTKAGQAAVTEVFKSIAKDSAKAIAEGFTGDEGVDLENFVLKWKVEQRTKLRERLLQVATGEQKEKGSLESALADAYIDKSNVAEVENTLFRGVLSMYLHAVRESVYKSHKESILGDYSGKGWAHMQLNYGTTDKVHCDLIGFSADLKELSEAFEETGFDPAETGIPVVLTIHKPSKGPLSSHYEYETWWVSPNYGQLWTETNMHYNHKPTYSRVAGGEGSTRAGKKQAPNSYWRFGFRLKLPVPAGFGGWVAIKDWRDVNIT